MGEVTATWLPVGDSGKHVFQRSEVYGSTWHGGLHLTSQMAAAPFGGPVVVVANGFVHIHTASGKEIKAWKWKGGARMVAVGWSNTEEAVFVLEDGMVLVYDVFGELKRNFSMGQEAKDLKILDAKVFHGFAVSGVAVLTSARRFFVVNNVAEPRVRKIQDIDWSPVSSPLLPRWTVLTSERHARVLVSNGPETLTVGQSDAVALPLPVLPGEDAEAVLMAVAHDSEHVAVLRAQGLKLWLGELEGGRKLCEVTLTVCPSQMAWCGDSAVLCFQSEIASFQIVTVDGDVSDVFMPGFMYAVTELDGVRVFTSSSQELIQRVPPFMLQTFSIGSVHPSGMLRMANEEFRGKSHKADECVRMIRDRLDEAAVACIECAGFVYDAEQQKELLLAAQFGKSFLSGMNQLADKFSKMCTDLRVLNSLRNYNVGMPLTLKQYEFLTPQVIVDRLLGRRLYPLAIEMCKILKIPKNLGETRALAHWACYKVGSSNEDALSVARILIRRLGNQPQISYCEVASKAAECGKKDLAIRLLENEVRISKQVPLLVKLGQESKALDKALASGNKDLVFTVILHLKAVLSSVDFHILVRKYPLAKVLYQSYCRHDDPEALEDWFIQEDDFHALAKRSFEGAFNANRSEVRSVRFASVQENFEKAKSDQFPGLMDEANKLLKTQTGLEDKLENQRFIGKSTNDTLFQLLMLNEAKLADRLKSDFKVSDKTFAWLKVRALSRTRQWDELKKFVRQKRLPVSVSNTVRIVKEEAGDAKAKEILSEDFVNSADRIAMYTELGMLAEAAQAAFAAKSMESLRSLEALSVGREDLLRTIGNFKSRLVGK